MSAQKSEGQFKVIIAIKCVKELNVLRVPMVRCTITLQDKSKTSSLPFSEGQFFDVKELDCSRPISLTFTLERTNKEIGTAFVHIPEDVLQKEEIELADDFAFEYSDKEFEGVFRGSYYIIILNKKNFVQREETQKKSVKFDSNEKDDTSSSKPNQLRTQGSLRSPLKKQGTMTQQSQPQPLSKEEEIKRQTSAKKLQDKVEATVKSAMKELQQSKDIDQDNNNSFTQSQKELGSNYKRGFSRQGTVTQSQLNRGNTTVLAEGDQAARISNTVMLTRSGTLAQKEQDLDDSMEIKHSPQRLEKMTTFNISESPSRARLNQSMTSQSPHKSSHSPHTHDKNYNSHNNQNLQCLYFIDQANQSDQLKTQTDYMKKTKIDSMKEAEKNNERLVVELQRAEQKRKEMERMIKDAADRSKQVRGEYNTTIDQIVAEKQELQLALRSKSDQLTDADVKIANLQFSIQQYQNQLHGLERKIQEFGTISKHARTQETKLEEYDRKLNDSVRTFENKLKELGSLVDGLEKQKAALQGEINKGQQQINSLKSDLNVQAYKFKELQHQNQTLERQVQVLKASEANAKSLNEQVGSQQRDLVELTRQKNVSEKDNSNLRKENGQLKNMLLEQEKNANDKTAALRQKIIELENKIVTVTNDQENLSKQNIALRQEVKTHQLNLCLAEDLMKQVDDEKHRCELLLQNTKESQSREKDLQSTLSQVNSNLVESRHQITDLQNQLAETQQYCAQLKRLILEMKETGVAYIPYHNDPIDKALADFINSMNDPSRLINLFVRESEGVYLFGNKKVYLKIEQDRILIRTGGGFMGIEEFLDAFAPAEMERMKEADPKKDYDKNMALQKTIEGAKVLKQIKSQTSPLKNRSPQH